MSLEIFNQSIKNQFISSFEREINSVNTIISNLQNEINEKTNFLTDGLLKLDDDSKIELERLSKKCDYLNAEIF